MSYQLIGQDPDLVFGINCDQGIAGKSFDVSGNGFDADLIGSPQQGRDRFGSFLGFDGSSYGKSIALDSYLDGMGEFTIACQARFSNSGTLRILIGWFYIEYNALIQDVAKAKLTVRTSAHTSAISDSDLDDGNVHFIVGTYDKNAGADNVLLYVDGEVQSNKGTTTGDLVSTAKFNIGARNDGSNPSFNYDGNMYTAAIYSKAKSAAWVQQEWDRFLRFQS